MPERITKLVAVASAQQHRYVNCSQSYPCCKSDITTSLGITGLNWAKFEKTSINGKVKTWP